MLVTRLEEYAAKYNHVKLERDDLGILVATMHTDGHDLVWGHDPEEELASLWEDIARDPENRVVVLTGSGETFIDKEGFGGMSVTPEMWHRIHFTGRRLIMSHLDIEVPMIAAINGPATIHSEIALLCDITLAAQTAVFADHPHFSNGLVPGDGIQVIYPLLMGFNRGRYMLLTGQHIPADEALSLGLINEVHTSADLMPRAMELARQLAAKPNLTLRSTRNLFSQQIRRMFQDNVGYGLMAEGLAAMDYWPSDDLGN
ncbi:enoyl-CoA hydratase/isomerase family protein [Streptomyces malaysiensis]|uniref:Enoyl-CoA hydratase/isomerase family protein n=1 Tax=Streptomyces malaysiensis subsp. samsunensis TaxID=459658 RepID=A0A9X2M313_STRMQ|nr:enoyl-CoA hydratase/isomerase family protein [Streptomyces samsunensis]MCQ8835490.1 enoyl-CoA hydratase/isomerase family protein [Streptomyces samsunensis]